ncbi:uncharacterized protein E0L32_008934 [Thyridium curvatum]|uniref:FAD dependent oxidoreductase domain-containing protein n=1 Tax=Thyridium curvatum TaxID=1093900 RepID=A0A507AK58_9PEZI|nr:uncharacterized protein E0L32_008934 [Thyridium curvatum]TPX09912.1 hypothetical protein E0L32_008934 [Thyridium curvatum]
MATPTKNDAIIIVGAGAFGLSTALALAERGYVNVTVFDKQLYDETQYSYFKGSDAASADINKIVRAAYGGQTIYQELSFEGIEGWKAWNDELASGRVVPPGMSSAETIFYPHGNLVMTDTEELLPFERDTIANMERSGNKDTQLIAGDARHEEIARQKGLAFAMDPFRRRARGQRHTALLDSTGGTVLADKACRFALCKARSLGVKFVFGPAAGAFLSLNRTPGSINRILGITTQDGKVHTAAFTIIACGCWTPTLLPQLDGLCEATAGSVVIFKIPKSSPLYDRLDPENFPSWQWNMRRGAEGGLYGFPRDSNGLLKIGYRGTKYTNPKVQSDGKERSVPITRWSKSEPLTTIPVQAMKTIDRFVDSHLPELRAEGINVETTRACWYTDSYDNHLVIDRVPDTEGLMVATGGSGHAFKYMPCIGKWIVDVMERVDLNRPAIKAWQWRSLKANEQPFNVLMEGSKGNRALGNVSLVHGIKGQERARL